MKKITQFWAGFVTGGQHVSIQEVELDMILQVICCPPNRGGWTLNLWMLQLGFKMLLGTNVTVDQMFSGHTVGVEMSLERSVGDRSIKVHLDRSGCLLRGHSKGWQGVLCNLSQMRPTMLGGPCLMEGVPTILRSGKNGVHTARHIIILWEMILVCGWSTERKMC
jgi:hypothetical protein